uniref:Uncharacterized protein n=1 Tax=Opuntia streptacantha TaxID=393608 RepID=A0A7C9E5J5_OPUST
MEESCPSSSLTFMSFASAKTRQAKPAAEEAKPAAVGKLLYEAMCTCKFSQSFFAILIPFPLSSTSVARLRISRRQFWYLPPARDISLPLSHIRSRSNAGLTATVVVVQR